MPPQSTERLAPGVLPVRRYTIEGIGCCRVLCGQPTGAHAAHNDFFGRPPTLWCTCPRPTTSTTPCAAASWVEYGQDALHSASERSCKASLRGALPGAGPAQPDGWNGGRLRPPDPGCNPGGRQHDGARGRHDGLSPAAEARVPRRRGRRRHAGHPGQSAAGAHAHHARQFSGALQQPQLHDLGQLHGGRLPAGGLRHDPERLCLEH